MSELENQNALMDALNSVQEVNVGDVVKGEVLSIDEKNQLIIGIVGAGVEGVVPEKELAIEAEQEVKDLFKNGDVLDLVVVATIGSDKENGSYLLSQRRIAEREIWEDLAKEAEADKVIEAKVLNNVKGGLVVDAGVRGFVPASMVENHFVSDLGSYKGKTMNFKIIEIDPAANRLILSHKAIAAEEAAEKRAEIMAKLSEGEIIEGKVARLTKFGAFIDLGGADGLVHISQIAHHRVNDPADELSVGETVKVKVISIDEEKGRIALSIKDTVPGPWEKAAEEIAVGAILEGTVKRLVDFGAFVEVMPGVEGLVHISEISHQHIATPAEVLKVGQAIQVKVLDIKPEERRLALSIKALEEKPESEETEVEANDAFTMPEEEKGFSLGDIVGNNDEK